MSRDPKLLAALAYLFGLVSGVGVLLYEKRDPYVRFHAMQSVIAFSGVAVVWVLLPTVPVLGDMRALAGLFRFGVACLWILLMYKAVTGETYRLPFIGDLASSLVGRR